MCLERDNRLQIEEHQRDAEVQHLDRKNERRREADRQAANQQLEYKQRLLLTDKAANDKSLRVERQKYSYKSADRRGAVS